MTHTEIRINNLEFIALYLEQSGSQYITVEQLRENLEKEIQRLKDLNAIEKY